MANLYLTNAIQVLKAKVDMEGLTPVEVVMGRLASKTLFRTDEYFVAVEEVGEPKGAFEFPQSRTNEIWYVLRGAAEKTYASPPWNRWEVIRMEKGAVISSPTGTWSRFKLLSKEPITGLIFMLPTTPLQFPVSSVSARKVFKAKVDRKGLTLREHVGGKIYSKNLIETNEYFVMVEEIPSGGTLDMPQMTCNKMMYTLQGSCEITYTLPPWDKWDTIRVEKGEVNSMPRGCWARFKVISKEPWTILSVLSPSTELRISFREYVVS